MGTIAELLGYSLSDEGDEGASIGAEASKEASTPEELARAREVAMSAVFAETGLAPADARPDLDLVADLDLDDLSRYAIVSTIEHELEVTILDQEVRSWRTLGELLDRVEKIAGI